MTTTEALEGLDVGCTVKLTRGSEWVTLWLDRATDDVLWIYGEGVVGNDSKIAPRAVAESQLEAHRSKGWELDNRFYS